LAGEGLEGTLRIDFHQPPAPGTLFIHRTHPLVACLADHLLENALDDEAVADGAADIARAGAIFTVAVSTRTAVLLLRLRHQLTVTHREHSRLLLCEETVTVAQSPNGRVTGCWPAMPCARCSTPNRRATCRRPCATITCSSSSTACPPCSLPSKGWPTSAPRRSSRTTAASAKQRAAAANTASPRVCRSM